MTPEDRDLAEAVRKACVQEALAAWEHARMAGLCTEGAWEAAIGAIRSLDLATVRERSPETPG